MSGGDLIHGLFVEIKRLKGFLDDCQMTRVEVYEIYSKEGERELGFGFDGGSVGETEVWGF